MRKFWVRTDSLPWAISLAGAVNKSPKEMRIALVGDCPVIKMIGDSVGGSQPVGEEIVLPSTEQELEWLDQAQAARMQREMEDIHGIVLDQQVHVIQLQYPQLVSNLLLHKYGVFAQHGYYCPDPKNFHKRQVQVYADYNVLVEEAKFEPHARAFCAEYGVEPNILDLSTLPLLEQVRALSAMNGPQKTCCFLRGTNPLNWVARAWYTDIDCLVERPAILSLLPATHEDLDIRSTLYWSQQIPVAEGDEPDVFAKRGYAWRVRRECSFDNHEYYRRRAAGQYGTE